MEEKRPHLVISEEKSTLPVLVIDKKGEMGVRLAAMLQKQFLTVLVSGTYLEVGQNMIHVPYRKKIPVIPDNHYSHIFVFYNGEIEVLDMLPALMKKANDDGGKLLFIASLTYSTPEMFKYFSQHGFHSMKVLLYGETFDKHATDNNIVSLFLRQAKRHGKIEVPDSLGKLYPILRDDVYDAIIAIAFGHEKKHLFLVFPKHPISELSIAHLLQKKDPMLKIDFKRYGGSPPHYYIPHEGEYFYPDYPLEKKIRSVEVLLEKPSEPSKKKKPMFPKQHQALSMRYFWLTLLCLLLSPIIIAIFAAVSGAAALQLSVNALGQGELTQARNYALFASSSLRTAKSVGSSLFYLDPFVQKEKNSVLGQIGVGQLLAETEIDLLSAITSLQKIYDGKSASPKDDFLQSLATLKKTLITLQKMRADGELPRVLDTKLANFEPILLPLENTIDALPYLLGFDGTRKYMVLFQNNMELRPGGGFIGSYGLLTLRQGRVDNFKVYDVYDADGKLSVHLEPPFGLRRYLGATHWFLRDSNFAIDFPRNAQEATNFLQLETGENVDGVIAVDTSFLKNVLTAIEPVTVTDYKETITADNFYLRTQTHAEKDFFPGSSQKKDFLRSLLSAMQQKLAQRDGASYQKLVGKIGESILEKHVLLVFSDTAAQKLFTINNLSSSIVDLREQGENTFFDMFGVIDANLGANKTNYYLKRSIDQRIVLDEQGKFLTTATITYTNSSKKDSMFGGDYRNYVRFVLPPNISLQEVSIDGVKQPTIDAITDPARFTAKNFIPPKELEIEHSQELGKDILGFLVLVPQGTSKKVAITYQGVRTFDVKKEVFSYDLWLFKQPGTLDDPYSLSFSYPATHRILDKSHELSDVGGKLLYSGALSEDKMLRAEFSKK